MRSIRLRALCAVAGIAFVLGLVFAVPAVRGQVTGGGMHAVPHPQVTSWPPHPRNMFYINEVSNGVFTGIPFGSYATVYTVPTDQWLVVTSGPNAKGSLGGAVFAMLELKGTTLEPLSPVPEFPLGFALAPGSQLVLRNGYAQTVDLIEYRISGYLVRD